MADDTTRRPARVAAFVVTPQANTRRARREAIEAPYGRNGQGRPDPGTDDEFAARLDAEAARRKRGEHVVSIATRISRGGKMIALLLCVVLQFAPAGTQAPVSVYVTSVGAQNGFTDPNKDNLDSVNDLKKQLKDKGLNVVEKQEDAAIVLTVQNRERANMTASAFGASRDCTVRVKFQYKDFQTDMSGTAGGGTLSSGGAWGRAAKKVAEQVAAWVTQNRARINADSAAKK